jgi:diguanylate cyclase (GGDEF)-like protein
MKDPEQPSTQKFEPHHAPKTVQHRSTALWWQLQFLLFPSADFADQKFQDHRHFTAIVSVFLSLLMPSLWIWDKITDPVGAANTLGLRLLYLPGLFMTLGFVYCKNSRRLLAFLNVWVVLAGEVVFVEILNRLEGGMVYGLAGFMYCLFLSVLSFQCFSLAINLSFTLAVAALPHGLAVLGFAHGFPHLQYAALMWPASILVILAQVAMAHHYLKLYELQRKLELLSNTDPLTGAKNRRFFMALLSSERRRAQRMSQKLALLMLDIDHFKQVNDTYGHPTGDRVICQVTDICHQVSREIDVVARLGGEEFAVFLPGSDLQQAVGVAERIRGLVEATAVQSLGAGTFHFTVSLGVAELSPDDTSELAWLSRADAALYAAKEGGRNRVMSTPC